MLKNKQLDFQQENPTLLLLFKNLKGIATSLRFSIDQDLRYLSLLESFIYFFLNVGMWLNIKIAQFEFIVTKFDHIVNHIIPFFDKYNIKGSKHGDLLYFKSDACIIKNKEHLNQDGAGLKKILLLKPKIRILIQLKRIIGMNRALRENGSKKVE